jgi:hypothetical protein
MGAITACRTMALGGHVERCDNCGATGIAYNSCLNRHCPKCQGLAARRIARVSTGQAAAGALLRRRRRTATMRFCSVLPLRRSPPSPADAKNLGAQIGVAMLGVRRCSIIRAFFAWRRAAASRSTARAGSLAAPASSYPCARVVRRLFLHLQDALDAGTRLFGNLAEPGSTNSDTANGSSLPNRRSAVPNRCSPISAAIRIASSLPPARGDRFAPEGRSPGFPSLFRQRSATNLTLCRCDLLSRSFSEGRSLS